jgi:aspartyl-tRNA(Asn)/glutamyl-tRNA(Gln) amidotransferase subunit C
MDKKELLKVAELAQIELPETELKSFAEDITKILKWIEKLNQVNTDEVSPADVIFHKPYLGKLRKDEIKQINTAKDLMANTSKTEHGYFIAPKIIEE